MEALDPTEVIDALMFEGTYVKEIEITPKTKAEFRVRSAKEVNEINRTLGSINPETSLQMSTELGLLTLAYACTLFDGKDLSAMNPYPERYNFFSNYPAPVVSILLRKLNEFDSEVEKALGQDNVENF